MQPTLYDGDHVLLSRSNNNLKFKDIVVITKSTDSTNIVPRNVIKRVIGVPGDMIEFKQENGVINLYRKAAGEQNWVLLIEPYITDEPMQILNSWVTARPNSGPITVAEGCIFVLGDNRNHSEDSRGKDGQYTINSVYGEMKLRIEKGSILEFILLKLVYQDQKSVSDGFCY